MIDRAQERCYYLTFYPARHILSSMITSHQKS